MGQLLKFSLEDHLLECEDRYHRLEQKIDLVDQRLDRIEQLILALKTELKR